jgi:hypothetical protein
VDITTRRVVPFGFSGSTPDRERYECLTELPVTPTGTVPAQIKSSLSYGFVYPILVVNAFIHTSHSLALRLYRPGYELVEIESWDQVDRVVWKPVADLETQEKVLDALLANELFVGSSSAAHRDVLRFGVAEYTRLAAATQSSRERMRLATKARRLARDAAEE